jgi:hypothetical protein
MTYLLNRWPDQVFIEILRKFIADEGLTAKLQLFLQKEASLK